MSDEVWTGTKNTGIAEILASSASATDSVREVWGPDVFSDIWSGGSGGGQGGSWTFDPEQIEVVIRRWEDLLEDLKGDRDAITRMIEKAAPPSEDEPSVGFTQKVLEGLRSLLESNMSMVAYVDDFLDKLYQARGTIRQTEDATVDSLQKGVFDA